MSPTPPRRTVTRPFVLKGGTLSYAPGAAGPGGHVPRRPVAGWLTTYGQLVEGQVVPTVDRDGQIMDAARELGLIDWTAYIKGGKWNDAHRSPLPDGRRTPIMEREARMSPVYVGVPTSLEYHDGTTALSIEHAKVGFWSAGHLFDRTDPDSWRLYTDYVPTGEDLLRSDAYWYLAKALQPTGASIGFSLHGLCTLSPCGKRIVSAEVSEAAICVAPRHPDATIDLLAGADTDLLDIVRTAGAARRPCGRCRCPAGACVKLAKGVDTAALDPAVPEDLEGAEHAASSIDDVRAALLERLIDRGHDPDTARRWLDAANLKTLLTEAACPAPS